MRRPPYACLNGVRASQKATPRPHKEPQRDYMSTWLHLSIIYNIYCTVNIAIILNIYCLDIIYCTVNNEQMYPFSKAKLLIT